MGWGCGGRLRSASSILSHVPFSAVSMPCCRGQGGARRGNPHVWNVNKGIFTNSAASKKPSCAISLGEMSQRTNSAAGVGCCASAELNCCCLIASEELVGSQVLKETDRCKYTHPSRSPQTDPQIASLGVSQDGLGRIALLAHPNAPEDPFLIHSLILPEATLSPVHKYFFLQNLPSADPKLLYEVQGALTGGLSSAFWGQEHDSHEPEQAPVWWMRLTSVGLCSIGKRECTRVYINLQVNSFLSAHLKRSAHVQLIVLCAAICSPRTLCALPLSKGQNERSPGVQAM